MTMPRLSAATLDQPSSNSRANSRAATGPTGFAMRGNLCGKIGAGGRNRTDTLSPEPDFESGTSTSSTTPATRTPIAAPYPPANTAPGKHNQDPASASPPRREALYENQPYPACVPRSLWL